MKKSKLILVAAIVPTLNCFDVCSINKDRNNRDDKQKFIERAALGSDAKHKAVWKKSVQKIRMRNKLAVPAKVRKNNVPFPQQQQNDGVVVNGLKFSQYNAEHQTINIEELTYSLNVKAYDVFQLDSSMTLGSYLRIYCQTGAAKLGMYNDILEKEIPDEHLEDGTLMSKFREYLIENGPKCSELGLTKWWEYLIYDAPRAALSLGLYTPKYLDTPMPQQVNGRFNDMTWREFLGVNWRNFDWQITGETVEFNVLESIFEDMLNKDLSISVMREILSPENSVFEDLSSGSDPSYTSAMLLESSDDQKDEDRAMRLAYKDGDRLTWKEYICYEYRKLAIKWGLYSDILSKVMPDTIIRVCRLPDGLTWMDFSCLYRCWMIRDGDIIISEDFLRQELPEQIVNLTNKKYAGLTWLDFFCFHKSDVMCGGNIDFIVNLLDRKVPDQIVEQCNVECAGLNWRDFLRLYNYHVARKLKLYDKILDQQIIDVISDPRGVCSKYKNLTLRKFLCYTNNEAAHELHLNKM